MSASNRLPEGSSSVSQPDSEPESPFLDLELLTETGGEAAEEWASRLGGQQLESPFQSAFEDVQETVLEPEVDLVDEGFYDEELDQVSWDGEINRTSPAYIRWVQQSLNHILGAQLSVDGIIGAQTRNAIRRFQMEKGLTADGIVGRKTEAALFAAGAGQPPTGVTPTVPIPAPRTTTGFTPVPVEDPGGGRIRDKRDPVPADLVSVAGLRGRRIQLHRLAANAWRALVSTARAEGILEPLLLPTSGYRSSRRQAKLFRKAVAKYGSERKARKWVAPPGHSAHQSGRAIDFYLGGSNSSRNVRRLREKPAYLWLVRNAERFGFYPYKREPWHWEYNPPANIEEQENAFDAYALGEGSLDIDAEALLLEAQEEYGDEGSAILEGEFADEEMLAELEGSIEGPSDEEETPYDEDEEAFSGDAVFLLEEPPMWEDIWTEAEEEEGGYRTELAAYADEEPTFDKDEEFGGYEFEDAGAEDDTLSKEGFTGLQNVGPWLGEELSAIEEAELAFEGQESEGRLGEKPVESAEKLAEQEKDCFNQYEIEKRQKGKKREQKCRERWYRFRNSLPQPVRDALDKDQWNVAIGMAIHHGLRDVNVLTDMIFLEWLGPQRGYCRLRKNEEDYIYFWKGIRKTNVRPRLALPSPPVPQQAGVVCVGRGERRLADPKPDRPGTEITGRYEHQDSTPNFGLRINQAGKHIECVLTPVLLPAARTNKRNAFRLHGDLQSDGSFSLFNRLDPDFYGRLRRDGRTDRLIFEVSRLGSKTRSHTVSLVSSSPTLMEKPLQLLRKQSKTIERYEWYPLTQRQLQHLSRKLHVDKIVPFLKTYFTTPAGTNVDQKAALNRAAKRLDSYLYKVFTHREYGIHELDIPLAQFYARTILTRNKWTFRSIARSQLDWIQIMLHIVARDESWGRLSNIRRYLGLRALEDRSLDPNQTPHTYKVTLKLIGAALYVQGYKGTITIEKTSEGQWKKGEKESYGIWLFGLSAGISIGFDDLVGVASTTLEWQPPDLPGKVSMVMGEVSAGVAAAQAGFMHIYGSGYFPPMQVLFADLGPNIELVPRGEGIKGFKKGVKPNIEPGIDLSGSWGKIQKKSFPDVDYSTSPVKTDYAVDYRLTSDIHFCLDSALLTEDARQALRILCSNELSALMSPSSHLAIIGHTDRSKPPRLNPKAGEKYNLTLSKLRAENTYQAIRDILGDKLMIPEKQIYRSGKGETEAIRDHRPPNEVNPKYRRVDVILNARLVLTLRAE